MIVRHLRRLFLRLLILLVVGGGVLFVSIAVQAASIRQQAVVEGDQVRLGDLFDGLPYDKAEREIAPAPAPGRRAMFDYRTLSRLARAYQVDWQATSTLDKVVVERAAHIIASQQIEDLLIKTLEAQGNGGELTVQLDNQAYNIPLPVTVEPTLAIEHLSHDPISGRFTAMIAAPATGDAVFEATLTGRSIPVIEVPVVTRPMRKGDVIGKADITMVKLPTERVGSNILVAEDHLVGMTPRRALSANTPVSTSDVMEPIILPRGTPVTIRLNHGGLNLTARGRVLDDAARGQLVRVMNISSNRVIDAIASDPATVTANLP